MRVEILFFEGCPNHPPAAEMVRETISALAIDAVLVEVEVRGQADAERLRFLGSPSIQVDGVDIEPDARTRTDYAFSCRPYGGAGLPARPL